METEEKEYYAWATQSMERLRGAALNLSTDIEFIVGEIIATHFCQNNIPLKNEFICLIINSRDLSFSSHIIMLTDILKHSYPTLDKSVMTKVDKFRGYRNKFAHCKLDASKSAFAELKIQRDKIRLFEVKGRDIVTHDFNVKEHILKLENDREIVDLLIKLRSEIKKELA